MQKTRPCLPLVIAAAALAAAVASTASAAGFGAAPSTAVLGQALDFTVQLRLDAGEALISDCLSAEVTVGERRLPAGAVRVRVQPAGATAARVHVTTTQAIDEPVVAVQLNAACAAVRVSQRFVLLADPPAGVAAVPISAAAAQAAALPLVPADMADAAADALLLRNGTLAGAAGPAMLRGGEPAGQASAPRGADARTDLRPPLPRRNNGAANGKLVSARSSAANARSNTASAAPRGERRATASDAAQRRARRTASATGPARTNAGASAAAAAPLVLAAAAPVVAPVAPRLTLDTPERVVTEDLVIDQALQAVAEAASAARAAASAASASALRIAALERTVGALRVDAEGNRNLAAQLSEKLARSENGGRWLWPLIGVVLLLALLAAWLGRRLAAAQRERQLDWRAASGAPPVRLGPASNPRLPSAAGGEGTPSRLPTAPIPFVTSVLGQPDTKPAASRPRPGPAWPPASPNPARPPASQPDGGTTPATPAAGRAHDGKGGKGGTQAPALDAPSTLQDPVVHRTQPLPPSFVSSADAAQPAHGGAAAAQAALPLNRAGSQAMLNADANAPRDVTIEELIDLEQQAEFFVVLGQDDAATELLVEHLRNTGGGSPLPYLKLLEIYRRRGDHADYERMRTRFNHRFNAYAPEWGVDLQAGRTLEHYTGVIPRLQQVWVRPLDAMAELEALLFRKSRGDLFDLPAYREVLFLYSLARDLLDREPSDSGSVDLLLPLADGGEFSSTSPAPFLGLEGNRQARADEAEADERPTAPVDFDLSAEIDRPASIFDAQHESQTPRR